VRIGFIVERLPAVILPEEIPLGHRKFTWLRAAQRECAAALWKQICLSYNGYIL